MNDYDKILDDIDKCNKIIEKHFTKHRHNVLEISDKDREYFSDFAINELFENSIMIDTKSTFNKKHYLLIKPNLKQKIIYFMYKYDNLIVLLSLCLTLAMFINGIDVTRIEEKIIINVDIGNLEILSIIVAIFIINFLEKLRKNLYDYLIKYYME